MSIYRGKLRTDGRTYMQTEGQATVAGPSNHGDQI